MLTSLLVFAGIVPLVGSVGAALVCRLIGLSPRAIWATSVTASLLSAQIGWKNRAGFAVAAQAFTNPAEAADWLPMILVLALGLSLLLIVTQPARPRMVIALAG